MTATLSQINYTVCSLQFSGWPGFFRAIAIATGAIAADSSERL
ncbi:hypothetical protein [Sodalinema gerasimenkoae]|nr:hypothetical protein [Sodalinema gerasimenkoae]